MDGDANHIESTEEFFTDRAAVLEIITKLTTEGGVNDNEEQLGCFKQKLRRQGAALTFLQEVLFCLSHMFLPELTFLLQLFPNPLTRKVVRI